MDNRFCQRSLTSSTRSFRLFRTGRGAAALETGHSCAHDGGAHGDGQTRSRFDVRSAHDVAVSIGPFPSTRWGRGLVGRFAITAMVLDAVGTHVLRAAGGTRRSEGGLVDRLDHLHRFKRVLAAAPYRDIRSRRVHTLNDRGGVLISQVELLGIAKCDHGQQGRLPAQRRTFVPRLRPGQLPDQAAR